MLECLLCDRHSFAWFNSILTTSTSTILSRKLCNEGQWVIERHRLQKHLTSLEDLHLEQSLSFSVCLFVSPYPPILKFKHLQFQGHLLQVPSNHCLPQLITRGQDLCVIQLANLFIHCMLI